MRDFSSPTKVWTHVPCIRRQILNHWATREVPQVWDWNAVVVQSLSDVWLFATPWTTACQASLSLTISWSLPKSVAIESVKTLESPLDCKKIKLVNPKGNQPLILIGRTYVEAETPILRPPNAKSQLIGKDLMLGKTEGRRRRGWQRIRWLDGIIDSMDWNRRLQSLQQDQGILSYRNLPSN